MNHSPSNPLAGDTARQAIASIHGFVYQIWRTLEAWIQLQPGEILYIECAEDFDVVSAGQAKTVQVKSSRKPISLGTADARQAIKNYWSHRQRNPGFARLQFQFLTQGSIATEKGAPFGATPGIELWRQAAIGDAGAAELLRRFLIGEFEPGSKLHEFLQRASVQELSDQLFWPFQWVTEEPDIDLIRRNIERRLVIYGENHGYPPSVSVKALDGLLAYCWSVAQKARADERNLTREDFALHFFEKTSIPVPQTAANLTQFAHLLGLGGITGGGLVMRNVWAAIRNLPPPLPKPALQRTKLVSTVTAKLSAKAPILVAGSVGKGKTAVARLVAEHFQEQCVWVELTGRDETYVEQVINMLAIEVGDRHPARLVVVDDLNVGAGLAQPVWSSLELLNRACQRAGCHLLITAQGIPENRVDSRLRLLGTAIVAIPDLDIGEIEELFSCLGCPDDARLGLWAQVTQLQTGGNPKLVHLRGLELQDEGWPAVTPHDLAQTPPSIEGQRAQQRLDVSKKLNGPELEYLYLFTLVVLPFDRAFALHLGSQVHDLAAPGDCFDRFAGRWLDGVGKDLFKITSLLSNQANQAWPPGKVVEAHGRIFDAYAMRQTLNISEAISVLTHAIASEDGRRVGGMVTGILGAGVTIFAQLAKVLIPVVRFGKGIGACAFPKDKKASLLLRALQFKVADREVPEEAGRIAQEWDWEIEQLPPGKMKDGSQLIYAFCILISQSETVPAAETVRCLVAVDRLKDMHPHLNGELSDAGRSMLAEAGTNDLITLLFSFVQMRCREIESLSSVLDALAGIPSELRNRMLAAFELPEHADYGFILSAWTGELKKEQPNWPRVEAVLRKAWRLAATDWDSRVFGVKAAKALSILLDEHLNDRHRAELVIAEAKQRFPDAPILDEQLANIRFQHDDFSGALEIWPATLALDSNHPGGRVKDPYAFRRAGIAAANLGRFDEAASLFAAGAEWASRTGRDARTGLYFDAALCAFKGGDWPGAQSALMDALSGLQDNPDPDSDFRAFALQKVAGHAVLWMLNQVTAAEFDEYDEPMPGVCSSPELPAGIKYLPHTPVEFTITHAIELEHALQLEPKILHKYAPTLMASRMPGIRIKLASVQIGQAFRALEFFRLQEMVWEMQQAYWQGFAQQRKGQSPLEKFEEDIENLEERPALGVEYFLLCALTLHKLSGKDEATLINAWQAGAAALPNPEFVREPLRLIEQSITLPMQQARHVMRDQSAGWMERLAAAVAVLTSPVRVPDDTAYAQIALLFWLSGTSAKFAVVAALESFSALFAEAWRPHIESPALLRDPRLTIPDLWRIVNNSYNGPRKLKELFRVVEAATGLRVPAEMVRWLGEIESRGGQYQRN